MKTSLLARAVAFVAAGATTFALVQTLAVYGLPVPERTPTIAQAERPQTPP
jgi:hypothetical protein